MDITFERFLADHGMIKVTIEAGLIKKQLTLGLSKKGQALVTDLEKDTLIDPKAHKELYELLKPLLDKHAKVEIW